MTANLDGLSYSLRGPDWLVSAPRGPNTHLGFLPVGAGCWETKAPWRRGLGHPCHSFLIPLATASHSPDTRRAGASPHGLGAGCGAGPEAGHREEWGVARQGASEFGTLAMGHLRLLMRPKERILKLPVNTECHLVNGIQDLQGFACNLMLVTSDQMNEFYERPVARYKVISMDIC